MGSMQGSEWAQCKVTVSGVLQGGVFLGSQWVLQGSQCGLAKQSVGSCKVVSGVLQGSQWVLQGSQCGPAKQSVGPCKEVSGVLQDSQWSLAR